MSGAPALERASSGSAHPPTSPGQKPRTAPQALTPREQCDGDWEFWCELMDTMLNGGKMPARAKVAACRAALEAGDATDLRLQAHALKSTAAALCVNELRGRCLELERSAQAPETSAGWPAQVAEIADAISRLDLTWRWVRSLGAAERDAAFESVNGYWEALHPRVAVRATQ